MPGRTIAKEATQRVARTHAQVHRAPGGRGQEGALQYLKDNLLVYGKLGNDVRQKQVSTVFAGRIHASLGQQAGPCEGHQAAQLAVAVLVVVVDVVRGVLHQQRGVLQEVDPQRVQHVCLLLRVQHLRAPAPHRVGLRSGPEQCY